MATSATPTKRAPVTRAPAAKKAAATKAAATKAVRTAPPKKAAKAAPAAPAPTPPATADGPPAGWYPTTADPTLHRFWDGRAWLGEPVPADLVPPAEPAAAADAAEDEGALVIEPIVFRGRSMAVNSLDAGKLGVWQIIVDEFNAYSQGPPAGASEAMVKAHTTKLARLLKQGIKLIRSVLADDADRDWLVDQLMEGDLTLEEATVIVTMAVRNFVAAKEKAGTAAPTTGPAPRVRRRSS